MNKIIKYVNIWSLMYFILLNPIYLINLHIYLLFKFIFDLKMGIYVSKLLGKLFGKK